MRHRLKGLKTQPPLIIHDGAKKLVDRLGNAHHRFDGGHVRAATQRVPRAMQRRINFGRGAARPGVGDKLVNGSQMALRFLAENIQQHGIKSQTGVALKRCVFCGGLRLSRLRIGHDGVTTEQLRTARDDIIDIALRPTAHFKLLHQFGQGFFCIAQHAVKRVIRRDILINDRIKQLFDRPREFGNNARAHHASAAFERMVATPDIEQAFAIVHVFAPARELSLERGDFLLGLFDVELEKLRVHVHAGVVDDRIFQIGNQWRISGGLGHRSGCRFRRYRVGRNARGVIHGNLGRRLCLRRARLRNISTVLRRLPAQRAKAVGGIVEHVAGVTATFAHRVHVILNTDNGIGQSIQLFAAHVLEPVLAQLLNVPANGGHLFHSSTFFKHQEAGFDATQPVGHVIHCAAVFGAHDQLRQRVLDLGQVVDALPQHRLHHVASVALRCDLRGCERLRRLIIHVGHHALHELFFKSRLAADQHRCDGHQRFVAILASRGVGGQ